LPSTSRASCGPNGVPSGVDCTTCAPSEAWSNAARARRAVPYGAKFSGVARCARSCTRRAGGAAVGGSAVAEACGVAEAIAASLAACLAALGRAGTAGGTAACMTLQQAGEYRSR
jgi:hypothetical protein